MQIKKFIYLAILFLFIIVMFSAPVIYIYIRLHEKH